MQTWWLAARAFERGLAKLSSLKLPTILENLVSTNSELVLILSQSLALQQKSLAEIESLKQTANSLQEANLALEDTVAQLQAQLESGVISLEVVQLAQDNLAQARANDAALPDITDPTQPVAL